MSSSRAVSPSQRRQQPWQHLTVTASAVDGRDLASAPVEPPASRDLENNVSRDSVPSLSLRRQPSSASSGGAGSSLERQQSLLLKDEGSSPRSHGNVVPAPQSADQTSAPGSAAPSRPPSERSMTGDVSADFPLSTKDARSEGLYMPSNADPPHEAAAGDTPSTSDEAITAGDAFMAPETSMGEVPRAPEATAVEDSSTAPGPGMNGDSSPLSKPDDKPSSTPPPATVLEDDKAIAGDTPSDEAITAGDAFMAPETSMGEVPRAPEATAVEDSSTAPETNGDSSLLSQPEDKTKPSSTPLLAALELGDDLRGSSDSPTSKTPSSRRHEGLEPKLEGLRNQLDDMQRDFLSSPHSVAGAAAVNGVRTSMGGEPA